MSLSPSVQPLPFLQDRCLEFSCDNFSPPVYLFCGVRPSVTALHTLILNALTGSGDPIGSHLRGSDGREVGHFVLSMMSVDG